LFNIKHEPEVKKEPSEKFEKISKNSTFEEIMEKLCISNVISPEKEIINKTTSTNYKDLYISSNKAVLSNVFGYTNSRQSENVRNKKLTLKLEQSIES